LSGCASRSDSVCERRDEDREPLGCGRGRRRDRVGDPLPDGGLHSQCTATANVPNVPNPPNEFWWYTSYTYCSASLVGPSAVLLAAYCIDIGERVRFTFEGSEHSGVGGIRTISPTNTSEMWRYVASILL
jgi:hypothetical protein